MTKISEKLRTLDLNADEKSVTKSLESVHLTQSKTRNLTQSKIAIVSKFELTTKIHTMMSMERNRGRKGRSR